MAPGQASARQILSQTFPGDALVPYTFMRGVQKLAPGSATRLNQLKTGQCGFWAVIFTPGYQPIATMVQITGESVR